MPRSQRRAVLAPAEAQRRGGAAGVHRSGSPRQRPHVPNVDAAVEAGGYRGGASDAGEEADTGHLAGGGAEEGLGRGFSREGGRAGWGGMRIQEAKNLCLICLHTHWKLQIKAKLTHIH